MRFQLGPQLRSDSVYLRPEPIRPCMVVRLDEFEVARHHGHNTAQRTERTRHPPPLQSCGCRRDRDRDDHGHQQRQQQRRQLEWTPLLKPYTGPHPRAAHDWIASRSGDSQPVVGPRRWRLEHLRLYASEAIERLTGMRVFEYRNYDLV